MDLDFLWPQLTSCHSCYIYFDQARYKTWHLPLNRVLAADLSSKVVSEGEQWSSLLSLYCIIKIISGETKTTKHKEVSTMSLTHLFCESSIDPYFILAAWSYVSQEQNLSQIEGDDRREIELNEDWNLSIGIRTINGLKKQF